MKLTFPCQEMNQLRTLVLHDLSAAFDTTDHYTLLSSLQILFGVGGSVLKWSTFYLTENNHMNNHNNQMFVNSYLAPPRFCPGPFVVLIVHDSPQFDIDKHKVIKFHFYACRRQPVLCVFIPKRMHLLLLNS